MKQSKIRNALRYFVLFATVLLIKVDVQAETTILNAGTYKCSTGDCYWKLTSDGDFILYGDGCISENPFVKPVQNRDLIKRVYCENIIYCDIRDYSESFKDMKNVESIDLSLFFPKYVCKNDALIGEEMFANCYKLKEIDLSRFDFGEGYTRYTIRPSVGEPYTQYESTLSNMFDNCFCLKKIKAPKNPIGEVPTKNCYMWCYEDSGEEVRSTSLGMTDDFIKKYGLRYTKGAGKTLVFKPIMYNVSYKINLYSYSDTGFYMYNAEANTMETKGNPSAGSVGFYDLEVSDDTEFDNVVWDVKTLEADCGVVNIQAPNIPGYKQLAGNSFTIDTATDLYDLHQQSPHKNANTIVLKVAYVKYDSNIKCEHNWQLVSEKQPTTQEAGYKNYTCSICTESRADVLDKIKMESADSESDSVTEEVIEESKEDIESTEAITEVEDDEEFEDDEDAYDDEEDEDARKREKKLKEIIKKAKETKASINKVSNVKGKKIKLTLKKKSGYQYQIKVSTSKTFKKNVKTYKTSKTSFTTSKLKKGKTYYVKARTVKKVAGKTYYGKWSTKKKIKIKK